MSWRKEVCMCGRNRNSSRKGCHVFDNRLHQDQWCPQVRSNKYPSKSLGSNTMRKIPEPLTVKDEISSSPLCCISWESTLKGLIASRIICAQQGHRINISLFLQSWSIQSVSKTYQVHSVALLQSSQLADSWLSLVISPEALLSIAAN